MSFTSKSTALGIAAGICGSLFIGYCLYFDHKRRSEPSFKEKLIQKRNARKAAALASKKTTKLPDLKDQEALQSFFIQEVQLGEELLSQGDLDNGVEHFGNAVAVCGHPHQLMSVLQQTLPPHVYNLLVKKLPSVGKKLLEGNNLTLGIIEDDVE